MLGQEMHTMVFLCRPDENFTMSVLSFHFDGASGD